MESAKKRIGKLFGQNDQLLLDHAAAQHTKQEPELSDAELLVKKAEALFDQVSEEDKEDMMALIEQINQCLEQQDFKAIEEPVEQLQDIIYYLES